MRLTAMTDYALRLLMHVAQHPQRLGTIAEAAQAHGISETHLMKVTHHLGLLGWIETVRGKGGGMRLARAPQDIRLGAVVRSMEPDFALVECFDAPVPGADGACPGHGTAHPGCRLDGCCALSGVIAGALQSFMQYLDDHTLADVLPGAPQPPRAVALPLPRAVPAATAG